MTTNRYQNEQREVQEMYTKQEAIAKAKLNDKNSKIAKSKINDWFYSGVTELWQIYGRHSEFKDRAMNYCKMLCAEYEGFNLSIISYNSMVFTVGFVFKDDDGKNIFAYITRDYDRFCYMD